MAIDTWELHKDQVLLGTLEQYDLDWPWLMCRFHATPEFEEYRSLFAEEVRLLDASGDSETWELAYQKIDDLQLTLHSKGQGQAYKAFLIHIKNDAAWFRLFGE